MPNIDGGHYFLTVLAPLRTETVQDSDGAQRSCSEALRRALACLPTAQHSPPAAESEFNSPFARNNRTHFTRLVVINDVIYGGRPHKNAILRALGGPNPLLPKKVDRLNAPYLLWAVDFDAPNGTDDDLASYLGELWAEMETELRLIFEYCVSFERVNDAESFNKYIESCRVETTMPFNDYWIGVPPLRDLEKKYKNTLIIGAAAIILLIETGMLWFFGPSWGVGLAGLIPAVLLAVMFAYMFIMKKGAKPFPKAPDSDLRSVLKALYLQQQFVEFVIKNQGAEPDDLHNNFAAFLGQHKPGDLDQPTQKPGVIASKPIADFTKDRTGP